MKSKWILIFKKYHTNYNNFPRCIVTNNYNVDKNGKTTHYCV